jgi:anti-sigma B factor antagonist
MGSGIGQYFEPARKTGMVIATREQGEATVVDVNGDIDMGTSPGLRKTLLESLKATPRLVVNLSGVRYIDSSGIASLVEVLKEARNKQKRLVLFGLNTAVREVLQLTRLIKIFEIRETEEQALA